MQHDHAETFRFSREDLVTTRFIREAVDVDDTVPVVLYSRPYERIEIERVPEAPAPAAWGRFVLTVMVASSAFAIGFTLAVLLL